MSRPLDEPVTDESASVTSDDLATLLTIGELTVEGRLRGSSNGTLRCIAESAGRTVRCVYKPVSGERPLWDFPDHTLGHREVATYLLASAIHALDPAMPTVVPTTVWREDGPLGPGACQEWIDASTDEAVDVVSPDAVPPGWRTVLRAEDDLGRPLLLIHADDPQLRRMALLDIVANNSDRKGGHVLRRPDGSLVGIDHGLCFNEDDKLRTVLWGWAGEPLTESERTLLVGLAERLDSIGLEEHLSQREIRTTARRLNEVLRAEQFPVPSGDWPAIPWPAL